MLCLRFTFSVATFISFEQVETFEQRLLLMGSAVRYCTKAEMSRRLSKELQSADIIGQYELFVRSTPWNKHPATLILKKICTLLTVQYFH